MKLPLREPSNKKKEEVEVFSSGDGVENRRRLCGSPGFFTACPILENVRPQACGKMG
jgi:hypothetical protein